MTHRYPIITVAFRSQDQLRELWNSLQAAGPDSFDLYVVDNSPDSADAWIASCERVHYLTRPDNPGFGASSNYALAQITLAGTPDWVVLLNPDTTVSPDFFDVLDARLAQESDPRLGALVPLVHLKQPITALSLDHVLSRLDDAEVIHVVPTAHLFDRLGRGMGMVNHFRAVDVLPTDWLVWHETVQPVVIGYPDGGQASDPIQWAPREELRTDLHLVNNAGSSVFSFMSAGDLGMDELDLGQYSGTAEVGAFCGAAVILSGRFLAELGGFDPGYFLYYEDTDLSVRGQQAGYRYLFDPAIRIQHAHSHSTSEGSDSWRRAVQRSQLRFAAAMSGPWGAVNVAAKRVLRDGRRWADLRDQYGFAKSRQSNGGKS